MLADSREFIRSILDRHLSGPGHSHHRHRINLTGDGLRDALDPKMRKG